MNDAKTPTTSGLRAEHVEWDDPRAVALREAMEAEMSERYSGRDTGLTPERAAALDDALSVDPAAVRSTIIIVDEDGTPVAHAAMKDHHGDWEMKRVVVLPSVRGRGIGGMLMRELEAAARAGGAPRIILQTGDLQPDAVRLYERSGYTPIPIYEPYVTTIPFSLCFELVLAP